MAREATSGDIMTEVMRAQDMITDTRGEALTPAAVEDAVARGIHRAVSDPEMWAAAAQAMQNKAKAEAGGWLLGGLRAAASKTAWFLVIGLGIYLVGGWSALVAAFKHGSAP